MESEVKWTEGLWEAIQYDDTWAVRSVYHDGECRVTAWPAVVNCGGQDNEANARLIAAAPSLYAALDALESVAKYGGLPIQGELEDARNALARARGAQ